jgi:hypothetical protein
MAEKFLCPKCGKQFDELKTVHSSSLEPFTATSVHVMEGLDAWGIYDAEKAIICHEDNFVHFVFLGDGEERLVQMVAPNFKEIETAREQAAQIQKNCEHEGCEKQGEPCYINQHDLEPNGYYCDDHKREAGFCPGCNLFWMGWESFDFSPTGLCELCADELADELDDFEEAEDDGLWGDE